jgi:hypothetical protein
MYAWVMSKSYVADSGEELPVAWSYGRNHMASGYQANGFGLVWLSLDAHQLEFLRSGIDDRVQVVGKEMSRPTPLLLETYADKLGDPTQYNTLQDVLDKLGETEPRFLQDMDPRKP